MVGAHRRLFFLVFFLSVVVYIHGQQPFQIASLRPAKELVWQRTSPSAEKPDGPVLYQILFRSSATPGSIPKIAGNFTLTNSLITEGNGFIAIGGMSISGGSGIITFANGQTFPGNGGGTVTSLSAGAGIALSPSPITTTGSIGIANGGGAAPQSAGRRPAQRAERRLSGDRAQHSREPAAPPLALARGAL